MTKSSYPAPPPPAVPGSPGLSGAPQSRSNRWAIIAGTGVALAVIVAAIIGSLVGWAMRGNEAESPSHPPPAGSANPASDPAPLAFTEEQARQRTCDAYKAIAPEWTTAYKEWIPTLEGRKWQWSDPDVREAPSRVRIASNNVAVRISVLMPVNTPSDVRDAVNAYTGAILIYGADLGWQAKDILTAHADAIDRAVVVVREVCGAEPQ